MIVAEEQEVVLRKSSDKGSNHVAKLQQGDSCEVLEVMTDGAGIVRLKVKAVPKGKKAKKAKKAKEGWIKPIDGSGKPLLEVKSHPLVTPMLHDATFEQEDKPPKQ